MPGRRDVKLPVVLRTRGEGVALPVTPMLSADVQGLSLESSEARRAETGAEGERMKSPMRPPDGLRDWVWRGGAPLPSSGPWGWGCGCACGVGPLPWRIMSMTREWRDTHRDRPPPPVAVLPVLPYSMLPVALAGTEAPGVELPDRFGVLVGLPVPVPGPLMVSDIDMESDVEREDMLLGDRGRMPRCEGDRGDAGAEGDVLAAPASTPAPATWPWPWP